MVLMTKLRCLAICSTDSPIQNHFNVSWTVSQQDGTGQVDDRAATRSGVLQAIQALRTLLGTTDMMAYLAMMAPRLLELHRVLKDTGSISPAP